MILKKKGQFIYTEAILATAILICIGFILFFMNEQISLSTQKLEESIVPQFYEEYPSVVLTTFISIKLSPQEILDAGLIGDKEFRVKDLLQVNSQESLEIFYLKRKEFLENFMFKTLDNSQKTYLDYFLENAQIKQTLNEDDFLILSDSSNNLPLFNKILEEDNFYYTFKHEQGTRVLLFKRISINLEYERFNSMLAGGSFK